jgi:hypothetical protein
LSHANQRKKDCVSRVDLKMNRGNEDMHEPRQNHRCDDCTKKQFLNRARFDMLAFVTDHHLLSPYLEPKMSDVHSLLDGR